MGGTWGEPRFLVPQCVPLSQQAFTYIIKEELKDKTIKNFKTAFTEY